MNYDIPAGTSVSVYGTCKLTPGGTLTISADTAGTLTCGPVGVHCAEGQGSNSVTIPDNVDPNKNYPFGASGFNKSGPGHLTFGGARFTITNERRKRYPYEKFKWVKTSESLSFSSGGWFRGYYPPGKTPPESARVKNVIYSTSPSSRADYTFDAIEVRHTVFEYFRIRINLDNGEEKEIGRVISGEPHIIDSDLHFTVNVLYIPGTKQWGEKNFLSGIAKGKYTSSVGPSIVTFDNWTSYLSAEEGLSFTSRLPIVDESGLPVPQKLILESTLVATDFLGKCVYLAATVDSGEFISTDWVILTHAEWITSADWTGSVGKHLKIRVAKNTSTEPRRATISIHSRLNTTQTYTITVTQEGTSADPPPPPEEYTILDTDKVIISHEAQRITLSVIQPETFTEASLDVPSKPWIVDGFGYDASAGTVFFDVPENTGEQREASCSVNCGGYTGPNNLTIIQRAKPRQIAMFDRHGKQVLLAGTKIFKILK